MAHLDYALIGAVCGFVVGILPYAIRWWVGRSISVDLEYIRPDTDDRTLQVSLVSKGSPARLRALKISGQRWPPNNDPESPLWPVQQINDWANRWRARGIVCNWGTTVLDQQIRNPDVLLDRTRGVNTTRSDWLEFKEDTRAMIAGVLGKCAIWYDPVPSGGCCNCGACKLPLWIIPSRKKDFSGLA